MQEPAAERLVAMQELAQAVVELAAGTEAVPVHYLPLAADKPVLARLVLPMLVPQPVPLAEHTEAAVARTEVVQVEHRKAVLLAARIPAPAVAGAGPPHLCHPCQDRCR